MMIPLLIYNPKYLHKKFKNYIIKSKIYVHVKVALYHLWVIPCEITHSKNESLPIVFILSTQSVHPI